MSCAVAFVIYAPFPNFSAYKLIEYTASKHLNNISYNYYGNKKTYHEFLKQIDDVARSLKAIGVKKKDTVSICMPNTPEGIISFYAANKIGAVSSMIHPLSAENEIKQRRFNSENLLQRRTEEINLKIPEIKVWI